MGSIRAETSAAPAIDAAAEREIEAFEEEMRRFLSGEVPTDRFRAYRLGHGVYGQRQRGVQMVRVKLPGGSLDAARLRCLAGIAESHADGRLHLTTRQDVQFHNVLLERVPALMRALAASGMTTREACGNSVRNVTACPEAGFLAAEAYDVQPYARAATEFLLRNPFAQQLARKFKMAFSACPEDCAATAIHDIGLLGRAVEQNGSPGPAFRVVVGGGLGSTPFTAQTLWETVPAEDLLVRLKAILKVFAAHGNRKNRVRARLKFVVHRLGIAAFRDLVEETLEALTAVERDEAVLADFVRPEDREQVAAHMSGRDLGCAIEREIPDLSEPFHPGDLRRWVRSNVRAHRDPGRLIVTVTVPLGDLEAPQALALAAIVERQGGGRLRAAVSQNLILPDVPRVGIESLHSALAEHGLAEPASGRATDVTSCPGTDTCNLGITSSKGLARAVRERLARIEASEPDLLENVPIKISGCPNACAQHHVAAIGFHGVAKRTKSGVIPAYQLHLGGMVGPGTARIGEALEKIPARRVPAAVEALLMAYREGRHAGEAFADFAIRQPRHRLREILLPFTEVTEDAGEERLDWGDDTPFGLEARGAGECAGAAEAPDLGPLDPCRGQWERAGRLMEREQWGDALADLDRSRYALARAMLGAAGRTPESDYEVLCEFAAHVVDRGLMGDAWLEAHEAAGVLLRTRKPDPEGVRRLHRQVAVILEEGVSALALLLHAGAAPRGEPAG